MSMRAASWAIRQPLEGVIKAVLLALSIRADINTYRCHPSIARQSSDSGASPASVKRALLLLAKLNLIVPHRRFKNGQHFSTVYTMNTTVWYEKTEKGDLVLVPQPADWKGGGVSSPRANLSSPRAEGVGSPRADIGSPRAEGVGSPRAGVGSPRATEVKKEGNTKYPYIPNKRDEERTRLQVAANVGVWNGEQSPTHFPDDPRAQEIQDRIEAFNRGEIAAKDGPSLAELQYHGDAVRRARSVH